MRLLKEDVKKQMEEREYLVQHFMSFTTKTKIEGDTKEINYGVKTALNFVLNEAYDILSHVSLERINFELQDCLIHSCEITEMEITQTDPNRRGLALTWGDVHPLETQYDWVSIFDIFYNSTAEELKDFSDKYYDGQDSGPVFIIPHSEYLDTLKERYYAENNVDDVVNHIDELWNKDSVHYLIDRLRTISTRVVDRDNPPVTERYYAENNVDDVVEHIKEYLDRSSIWCLIDRLRTTSTRGFNV